MVVVCVVVVVECVVVVVLCGGGGVCGGGGGVCVVVVECVWWCVVVGVVCGVWTRPRPCTCVQGPKKSPHQLINAMMSCPTRRNPQTSATVGARLSSP